jgi:hypothetical protein
MTGALDIGRFQPADLLAIELQPSQHRTLGLDTREASIEIAEGLADNPVAWSVRRDGRLIACIGIDETFAGTQGVTWAHLAPDLGDAHLRLTRFARDCVATCGLSRVEGIVRGPDAECLIASFPFLADDSEGLLSALCMTPTPEMIWARLCGLRPAHVLRKFGAAAETHVLFERIA